MPDDSAVVLICLWVILDNTWVYRISREPLLKAYERDFYVYDIYGYCVNHCRQEEQASVS
jgi:hypothetical protein